jgi:hypothetical protein
MALAVRGTIGQPHVPILLAGVGVSKGRSYPHPVVVKNAGEDGRLLDKPSDHDLEGTESGKPAPQRSGSPRTCP